MALQTFCKWSFSDRVFPEKVLLKSDFLNIMGYRKILFAIKKQNEYFLNNLAKLWWNISALILMGMSIAGPYKIFLVWTIQENHQKLSLYEIKCKPSKKHCDSPGIIGTVLRCTSLALPQHLGRAFEKAWVYPLQMPKDNCKGLQATNPKGMDRCCNTEVPT